MATVAARSVLRSAAPSARSASSRIAAGVKPKAASSPFRVSSEKSLSARIFRSPVEMSSVSVVSMLPYHNATASALLTSMLSVAPRSHAWTLEGSMFVEFVYINKCSVRQLIAGILSFIRTVNDANTWYSSDRHDDV